MTRPVVHFEIVGRDGARLQEFYRTLFGWDIAADANYALFSTGPGAPEILGGAIGTGQAPRVTVYVQVLDLDETLKKAEHMGGKTVQTPVDVPNGPTVAQFTDPEGNLIGLVKQ